MSVMDWIRFRIRKLYETDPHIHMNVRITHPKVNMNSVPVVIKDVYPNLFRIEEDHNGQRRCHSIQYAEVLMGQVSIPELGKIPGRG